MSHFAATAAPARRDWGEAVGRGLRMRCPACGEGRMFRAYLKVADACPACGEALHHHRADDAPPYVTISVVGHLVVGALLIVEQTWPDTPLWLHFAVWPALGLVLSLLMLPPIKSALVAHQWALRMHGFGADAGER
ncbi:MAG: DUF983 domain-containing protein [Methylobacteriaceae bacterium]|nr:DUF983 domain-containing protein [Methylobacteriaceae bacterium]